MALYVYLGIYAIVLLPLWLPPIVSAVMHAVELVKRTPAATPALVREPAPAMAA